MAWKKSQDLILLRNITSYHFTNCGNGGGGALDFRVKGFSSNPTQNGSSLPFATVFYLSSINQFANLAKWFDGSQCS